MLPQIELHEESGGAARMPSLQPQLVSLSPPIIQTQHLTPVKMPEDE